MWGFWKSDKKLLPFGNLTQKLLPFGSRPFKKIITHNRAVTPVNLISSFRYAILASNTISQAPYILKISASQTLHFHQMRRYRKLTAPFFPSITFPASSSIFPVHPTAFLASSDELHPNLSPINSMSIWSMNQRDAASSDALTAPQDSPRGDLNTYTYYTY